MSFKLTTEQTRTRQKTVTRRTRWLTAKVGDVVQPVVQAMGLKKGQHVETIGGPIRFVGVSREVLEDITPQDVFREGFPHLTVQEFIRMFKQHNGCKRTATITRIEFEYLDAADAGSTP